MKISKDMDLAVLAELASAPGDKQFALWARDMLVASGYEDTDDLPPAKWNELLEAAALRAEEDVHPSNALDMPDLDAPGHGYVDQDGDEA